MNDDTMNHEGSPETGLALAMLLFLQGAIWGAIGVTVGWVLWAQ